jgi:hypothetical protein
MAHERLSILDSKSNALITKIGSALFTTSYLDQVGFGDIPGAEIVHKFGYGAISSTSLVPVCSNFIYRTPTAATTLEILSSSADDTAGGTGAREVQIVGTVDGWTESQVGVNLSGTTPATVGTDFLRVYRMFVSQSGTYATQSTGSHAGTITLRESGGGDDWAEIPLINSFPSGQTTIGAYTIPSGKQGLLLYKNVFVEGNKAANIFFFRRQNADTITAPFDAMRLLELEIGVEGPMQVAPRSPIGPITGPADVGFMARVSAGTSNVSVDFEILVVDV